MAYDAEAGLNDPSGPNLTLYLSSKVASKTPACLSRVIKWSSTRGMSATLSGAICA